MLERLLTKWKLYRYRFVPWLALNLKDRSVRSVARDESDKITPDAAIEHSLVCLLSAFDESTSKGQKSVSSHGAQMSASHNLDVMQKVMGFCVERQPSIIPGGGTGVKVTGGVVHRGAVTSLYPGLIYEPYEPIFFQSIGNPFIFRCIDGLLIDGNDRRVSKFLYRSCHGRDRVGPHTLCDNTWLTSWPLNPLAVEFPANVAYQEFDVPADFPFHLRKYLPNNFYSPLHVGTHQPQRLIRLVALVAVRDIQCGEELFSSYFTVVH